MEKKRFKMYKRKKSWVVAPIVFLGLLGGAAFSTDQHSAYADEVSTDQVVHAPKEQVPIEGTNTVDTNSNQIDPSQDPAESTTDPNTNEDAEADLNSTESEDQSGTSGTEQSESAESKEDHEGSTEENKTETTEPSESESKNEESSDQETNTTETTEPTVDTSKTVEFPKIDEKPTSNSSNAENKTATQATTPQASVKAEPKAAAVVKISIFRVYNPNSGEHLHTMNSYEKDYLVRLGWRYEGVSMVVSNTGRQLFRIYNPNSGEHHFTLDNNEINMLKRAGWRYEGVAWLTPTSGVAMYRVFNPNARGAGSHHYTMNVNERNNLLKAGWRNEGISWYTLGTKSRQEIMVDWFYARQGKVTYSMTNRNGPNSYDCSSAVFYALIEAGYLNTGTWIGNTETLFSYEGKLFKAISSKDVRSGDIFISGKKGNSGGSAGHTGVATSNSKIIHCNYTDNGISETVITGRTGDPCYWFRLI
ncbi:KxYKxGKxW signal peptide domain-containing protein [Enterococcus hulanensis]|uniref:peptidoglycan amidohydrolase family protein n=1 Tax=Enterococcus hulanensis TaxID=2559929 RepID=UPI001A8C8CDE|nr:peptidoglycan amidohydrolase family protein [Enterococcus hulanensis]MBO0455825.1 KxYKxGKxW signal peptide domain-containing protein [Enterococcus hulanensis]